MISMDGYADNESKSKGDSMTGNGWSDIYIWSCALLASSAVPSSRKVTYGPYMLALLPKIGG